MSLLLDLIRLTYRVSIVCDCTGYRVEVFSGRTMDWVVKLGPGDNLEGMIAEAYARTMEYERRAA